MPEISHEPDRKEAVAGQNDDQISVPWKVGDAALATASVVASFLVILFLLRPMIGTVGMEEWPLITPWSVGAVEGVLLVAVWAFGIKKYHARCRDLGLRRPANRRGLVLPWVALLGSLAFTSAYVAIMTVAGQDSLLPSPVPGDALGHGFSRLLSTLVIAGWGPFAEEVFFRGFLLAALIPPLGAMRAAAVSSAVFAATHLMLGMMIPVFVTGLLLSWLYLKTRSIWPCIAAHAAQNLIAISATW